MGIFIFTYFAAVFARAVELNFEQWIVSVPDNNKIIRHFYNL